MTLVHEVEYRITLGDPDLFGLIPNPRFALVAAIILALAGVFLIGSNLILQARIPSVVVRGTTYLLVASGYTAMYGMIDEVAVNLEHSVNLRNSGRFSFSPNEMVGGTVELVYYALHAPFATTPRAAVIANFTFGLLLLVAHLALVDTILSHARRGPNPMFLFALAAPVTYYMASGFGNGLMSLTILFSIAAAQRSRIGVSLAVAALLPLLRPDGIVWAVVLHLSLLLWSRVCNQRIALSPVRISVLLVAPLAALALSASVFSILYGTYPPIPVQFKSVGIDALGLFDPIKFHAILLDWASSPFRIVAIAAVALLAAALWEQRSRVGSIFYLSVAVFIASLGPVIFFAASSATLSQWGSTAFWRYALPSDVSLALALVLGVGTVDSGVFAQTRKHGHRATAGVALVLMVYFVLGLPQHVRVFTADRWVNRDEEAQAGLVVDRVIPGGWAIATTEMNTFGLVIDRPVLDFWGYTNAEIARSNTCNGDLTRYSNVAFLNARPEVFFPYWLLGEGVDSDFEASLATMHHVNRSQGNRLGDMRQVMRFYDVVVISTNLNPVVLLVRNDKVGELFSDIGGVGAPRLVSTRIFDWARFESLYLDQETVSHPC